MQLAPVVRGMCGPGCLACLETQESDNGGSYIGLGVVLGFGDWRLPSLLFSPFVEHPMPHRVYGPSHVFRSWGGFCGAGGQIHSRWHQSAFDKGWLYRAATGAEAAHFRLWLYQEHDGHWVVKEVPASVGDVATAMSSVGSAIWRTAEPIMGCNINTKQNLRVQGMVMGSWCVNTMTSIPLHDLRPWAVDGLLVLEAYLEPFREFERQRDEEQRRRQQEAQRRADDTYEFSVARAAPAGQFGGTGASGDEVLPSAATAAGGVGSYRAEGPWGYVAFTVGPAAAGRAGEADGRGPQPPPPPPAARPLAAGVPAAPPSLVQGPLPAKAPPPWARGAQGHRLQPEAMAPTSTRESRTPSPPPASVASFRTGVSLAARSTMMTSAEAAAAEALSGGA